MTMSRKDAVDILSTVPYKYGHAVGFTKLAEIHNEWIQRMVFGHGDETLQAHRG